MTAHLKQFVRDENGAVTVDWVVLSAVLIGLAMLLLGPFVLETTSFTQDLGAGIVSIPLGYWND